jgi:hypothetical protein
MSRAATGDTVILKAGNNIYTGLAVAATIAVALGVVMLFLKSSAMLDGSLFSLQ